MNVLDLEDLEEVLTTISDEQQQEITHLWGIEGEEFEDFPAFIEMVMKCVNTPTCARTVWEYLSPDERRVFYHTMSYAARDGLRRDALQKKSQVPPEQFEPAMKRLIRCCLVYQRTEEMEKGKRGNSHTLSRDRRVGKNQGTEKVPVVYPFQDYLDTIYNVGREMFTPKGDRSQKSLEELLVDLDTEYLYDIYQHYTVKWGKYVTRGDFVAMMTNVLLQLEEPLDFIPELNERARELYLWLRQQGGRASMQDVRVHTRLNDSDLCEVIYLLEDVALAFDTLTPQGRVLFIPHDVFARLKNVTKTAPEPEVVQEVATLPEDFVPAASRHGEPILLYDMAFVLSAIYQQTIEPTQVGRVPKRIANKIRVQLRGQVRPDFQYDDNYLEMLLEVAKEKRLVRLSKSPLQDIKECYEPGEGLPGWSQLDSASQAASLLQHWKASYRWDDLLGVLFRAWDPYAWRPMAGRAVLLTHLAKHTPGRWYTIESLLQDIWDTDPFVMHAQSPYGRKTVHKKTPDVREKWERCDGETYIGMLSSTLHEMGIVDLGYERSSALDTQTRLNPQAFMLSEFGVSVLSRIEEHLLPSRETTRTLIVQPNFELLIMQPDMPTLYSLLPFAQLNQVGLVSRLTLNRAALLRAIERGKNIEQVLNILEERSQKELPQNVVYSLNDWARLYKGVAISQVLLLEVSSEAVAVELNTPRF
ncbi:MAG TPA: helicase-associated domain-containing protein, partial [Ktedonobacteraceae bacterium]|nr:helicase-associated domain-containing protein [Ktedonobacteraceae bacterium]